MSQFGKGSKLGYLTTVLTLIPIVEPMQQSSLLSYQYAALQSF